MNTEKVLRNTEKVELVGTASFPLPQENALKEKGVGFTRSKHLKFRLESWKSRVRSVLLILSLCFFVVESG